MKRNLIALSTLGLLLGANAVFASEWAFDDAYWKRPEVATVQTQSQTNQSDAQAGKYDFVDRYNP